MDKLIHCSIYICLALNSITHLKLYEAFQAGLYVALAITIVSLHGKHSRTTPKDHETVAPPPAPKEAE